MRNNRIKERGITLIALVITIIVLLLLAGISISMLAGNNSVLNRAGQSRVANALGTGKDAVNMAVMAAVQDYYQSVYDGQNVTGTYTTSGLDEYITKNVGAGNTQNSNYNLETTDVNFANYTAGENNTSSWSKAGTGAEITLTYNPDGSEITGVLSNGVMTWNSIENAGQKQSMSSAIVAPISVEERATVPVVISNKRSIEDIANCIIEDTTIATVQKDTDGVWKITGKTISGNDDVTTSLTIEGESGSKLENIQVTVTKATTAKDVIPVPTSSATSAYVYYTMKNQTQPTLCRVLYNDSTHGLQIITADKLDTIQLGRRDNIGAAGNNDTPERAKNSYNNAIVNLNNKAESYINTGDDIVVDARCIGSKSLVLDNSFTNKDDETNLNETTGFKGADTNYEEDFNKMGNLSIRSIGSRYYLASREINNNGVNKNVRFVMENGQLNSCLVYIYPYGVSGYYIRPVFLVNSTAKIKDGSGTSGDPYILEAGE